MLPQSKNSNVLTTAIVKKYKIMPCWIWCVLLTQLQKRFLFYY